jgi:hypothetical protein
MRLGLCSTQPENNSVDRIALPSKEYHKNPPKALSMGSLPG